MTGPSVVFVLVSDGCDRHGVLARIAVASLRLTNPSLMLRVVCDEATDRACRAVRDPLMAEVDDWQAVAVPAAVAAASCEHRHRFLKTSLRMRFEGTLLVLDTDVLVRGDLSSLFSDESPHDIAAARNHSLSDRAAQTAPSDVAVLETMRWTVRDDIYLNGGVMVMHDTPGARAFAADWHRRWCASSEHTASYRDQPAMNAALAASGVRLRELSDGFNAQFEKAPAAACGAMLWHYYGQGQGRHPRTAAEELARAVLAGAPLERRAVQRLIDAPHPWRRRGMLADLLVRRAVARGVLAPWEQAFLRKTLVRHVLGPLVKPGRAA